jgi:hypothetical protein
LPPILPQTQVQPERLPEGSQPSANPATPAIPAPFVAAADKLAAATTGNRRAWNRLAEMCDTFGHRMVGSKALEGAIKWSADLMTRDGLAEVRVEPAQVEVWQRGEESVKVVAPFERDLVVLGLGGTIATPKKGLRGEIVVVENLDQIQSLGSMGRLKDKIVVINQPMPPFDHEHHSSGYGTAVVVRSDGAPLAARQGAKAVLIRSITAHSLRTAHTGSVSYKDDIVKIPAAALSPSDADFLARMAARGPVSVDLRLNAKNLGMQTSGNVIAELKGREKPDEIVVMGGHIDSWDVGQGAQDDGTGVHMAIEAALLLKELNLIPKRTIRVVLFTGEEHGLGGAKAYFAAHQHEKHVGAIESDSGSFAPEALGISGKEEETAALFSYAPLFAKLGVKELRKGGGGADIGPLMRQGVLGVSIAPDASHYFDYHHTIADTVDTVDPDYLEKNAASMALMAYILAER